MAKTLEGEVLLTEKELSRLTDIPASTLRSHRKKKIGLPFIKIGGLVYYPEKAVQGVFKQGK